MLDPDLQNELRQATTTAVVLHVAMLFEPVVLVVMAVVLGKSSILENAPGLNSDGGSAHALFVGMSALSFGLFFLFRRSMLSPEKLAPEGADAKAVVGNYKRAQIVPNACAVAPSILGLVNFVITGDMTFLFVCAAIGVAMMIMTFPRHETLEAAVEAWLERGETSGTAK